ncbi:MAG TPA: NAD(P)/FAD-dependent oxidoreductase [Ignavibacteriales bacterium]|nr:NAD(P)/FAD-dependent oxidoreductase [Ignavibacteriales bacterium]
MPDTFDVIIIGGSYAGLSAAMALGRSLRNVLIIDSGSPCNKQTPHSHNFLTQDGETPANIASKAKRQVLKYSTVKFIEDKAVSAGKKSNGFEVVAESGEVFSARKLLLATGIHDIMPDIDGFKDSWGITVLHCPYCHGYEVNGENLGILANGEAAFEMAKFISNWSGRLTLFTNGPSSLTTEQTDMLADHNISIVEKEILLIDHEKGVMHGLIFKDGSGHELRALFYRAAFRQHSDIAEKLGCELTPDGYIKIGEFQETTVPGVYAAGDNSTMLRSVAVAASAGMKAGAFINKEIIMENFAKTPVKPLIT